jgi:hypothetical protein
MILDALANLNWIAVAASALVAFGIGLAWFAPRSLGTIWARQVSRYTGIPTSEVAAAASRPPALGAWLTTIVVNAVGVALVIELGGARSAWDGALIGLALGVGLGATLNTWPLIFAGMPRTWWMLNNGAFLVMQVAMGAILGAWH